VRKKIIKAVNKIADGTLFHPTKLT
jgi:hypothetical protein